MVKNSFIEKTYVLSTHWTIRQFHLHLVPTAYVTENKEENYLEFTLSKYNVHCFFLF